MTAIAKAPIGGAAGAAPLTPGGLGRAAAGGRRPYRSLHVIDLESLAAAIDASAAGRRVRAWPPDRLLRQAWAEYAQEVGVQRGDHALVGLRSGRCGRLADLLAASGAQLRVAPNARGVCAELAGSVDVGHAARRFDCLVIAGACEELAVLAAEGLTSGMRVWHVGGTSPAALSAGVPRIRWARLLRVRAAA
jgi:hypothetical protein